MTAFPILERLGLPLRALPRSAGSRAPRDIQARGDPRSRREWAWQDDPGAYAVPPMRWAIRNRTARGGGRPWKPEPRRASAIRAERKIFAARVADGAADASATLEMGLGGRRLCVTRALDSLSLSRLLVDGQEVTNSEATFQEFILELAGVSSFGDWILLLRNLTFYFEDRRALVWDPSAQRQILRVLFTSPDTAADWVARERAILERDSRVRNLQAALYKEEQALTREESAAGSAEDFRNEMLSSTVQSRRSRTRTAQRPVRRSGIRATARAARRVASRVRQGSKVSRSRAAPVSCDRSSVPK